ncbi:uncharacterized protein LOC131642558 [Vicia villosa]|uniref:uncharacterized protein LOC131642558 n=1 Tax=Vicia villosa TaxID=3911 RepID=UPI00273B723D|nr:uncharacterized protein LOC131642558 [Vicia villosa]
MLAVEADNMWLESRRRLEASGAEISWVVLRIEFLRKYFPEDVRCKKGIEFLDLRKGNKSVMEYAAKLGELAKFYQHCDGDNDNNAHYRVINEKRGNGQQGRGMPYEAPNGKGKQKVTDGKRTSGEDAPAGVVCFKCGKVGHKSNVCTGDAKRCFRFGEVGHMAPECKHKQSVRFSSSEEEGVELLSARKLRLLVKEDVQVFALVASMSVENQAII